jgi:cobalt-zinc-cadmium efflux system membrane fusion protein
VQIPERLAGAVRPGMAVVVEQDGVSAKGAILSVAPSLDPVTRSVAAKASLAGGSALVPGKGVMVAIAGTGQAGGVSVPAAAVARVDGADQVFLRVAQGFRRVSVRVAGQIGGRAFIAGGLKPGDVVAASGVAELKSLSTGG